MRLHVCRCTFVFDAASKELLERDWTNVLFTRLPYPRVGSWFSCDVRRGLPFPGGAFDIAYVNHVFEHLTPAASAVFAAEVRRVLAPGGFVRVATPDLEVAARRYLEQVDAATRAGSEQALRRHYWATLVLIDQLVRERTGGLLLEALRAPDAEELREQGGRAAGAWVPDAPPDPKPIPRSLRATAYALARRIRRAQLKGDPRRTLEAARWMWDRISLPRLLADAGFVESEPVAFDASRLPGWEDYDFDRTGNGAYDLEPSIYVEAKNDG